MSNHESDSPCRNCAWFEAYPNNEYGICHRHAPSPRVTDQDPISWPSVGNGPFVLWPSVSEDDWCGEFEPKGVELTR